MIDSRDLTEEELQTLRGDAVGSSAHSSVWILKTLTFLHESLTENRQFVWTDKLEEDFCLLWDISIDDDVKSFLREHNFFNLAGCILIASTEPRLIEIILGILVNVYCSSETLDSAGDMKFVPIILKYLSSDDPRILIQILRLLQGVVWRLWSNKESIWATHLNECDFFAESIIFMLENSTNGELLAVAVELLKSIFNTSLEHIRSLAQKFEVNALIHALIESYTEVIPKERKIYTVTDKQFIKNWLNILENLAEMRAFESYKNSSDLSKLTEIVYAILMSYQNIELPVEEPDFLIICHSVNIIYSFHYFNVNVPLEMDRMLVSLAFFLQKVDPDIDTETKDLDTEKPTFQLSVFMNNYWLKIIRLCTKEQITEMMHPLEPEIYKYLIDLTESDTDTTRSAFDKINSIRNWIVMR